MVITGSDCKIFRLSNSSQMKTFAFAEEAALMDLSGWFSWVARLGRRPDEDRWQHCGQLPRQGGGPHLPGPLGDVE